MMGDSQVDEPEKETNTRRHGVSRVSYFVTPGATPQNPIFDKIRIASIEAQSPNKIVVDIDKNEFKQNYDDSNNYDSS